MKSISTQQLHERMTNGLADNEVILDVRGPQELEEVRIDGVMNIPVFILPQRAGELSPDTTIYCICASGGRSGMATQQLESLGYTNVYNVDGGMIAWVQNGLPTKQGAL